MDKENQKKRVILITGSNRGLGYGLVLDICSKYPQQYRMILTSRDQEKGEKALDSIKQQYPSEDISYIKLDVLSEVDQESVYEYVKSNYQQLDVLVNNAGIISPDEYNTLPTYRPSREVAEKIIQTNLYAPINLTNKLLPLLSEDCKILHIGSRAGLINVQPKETQKLLEDSCQYSQQDIFNFAQEFIDECSTSVEEKPNDQTKWLMISYQTSKCLLNAYVRYVGTSILKEQQNMFVVTPGWVRTDMGGEKATRSIVEGNDTTLYLIADLPYQRNNQFNCRFIGDRITLDW